MVDLRKFEIGDTVFVAGTNIRGLVDGMRVVDGKVRYVITGWPGDYAEDLLTKRVEVNSEKLKAKSTTGNSTADDYARGRKKGQSLVDFFNERDGGV